MREHEIIVNGGSSARLLTAGKYCDRDIVVTATGSDVELPELTTPGTASDLMAGTQLLDGSGNVVDGTFSVTAEITEQAALIEQIKAALQGKAAGGGSAGNTDLPSGYRRVDYIRFTGEQIVDTGIICNQNTQIRLAFTREKTAQHYMYGVASSDNTASVTAYMGGSWRFGNKTSTKNLTTNADMIYSAVNHVCICCEVFC
jgi:hypothetical protein